MALTGLLDNATLANVPGSPGQRLRADAAEAWGRVVAALLLRGVVLHLTDSYRPLSVQTSIFLARYQRAWVQYAPGRTDCRVWNGVAYYRRPGTAAAAIPGTSNHGRALAVDCGVGSFGSDTFRALSEVGPRNGWTNVEGRSVGEPWHWVYNPFLDARPVGNVIATPAHVAPIAAAPAPVPLEEQDTLMRLIQAVGRGIAVIGPGYYHVLTDEELTPAQRLYGKPHIFDTPREYDLAVAIARNPTAR